mgnify:CR=1 FL=1
MWRSAIFSPPRPSPRLLANHRKGYSVYTRQEGHEESRWLRLGYWTFYRVIAALTILPFPLDARNLALMSGRMVEEIRRMPERDRYVRGLST